MSAPLVDLRNASIRYNTTLVLRDITIGIEPGEFTAVVGANGAGKSTLVKGIVGLIPLDSGTLEVFGTPFPQFDDRWRVGYVPQRHTVGGPIPATVREVVASGRLAQSGLFRWPGKADRAAVDRAMERVGVGHLERRPVHQLSGGQQRRVLIARALAGDAELLLLDEPTAGVDVEAQANLVEVLSALHDDGVTVVVVTHDLEPFAGQLSRVVWMSRGQISYDGPPTADVLAAASEPFAHHDHHDDPTPDSMPGDLRTGR